MFGILMLEYSKPVTLRQRIESLIFGSHITACFDTAGRAAFVLCSVSVREGRDGRAKGIRRALGKIRSKGAFRVIVPPELEGEAVKAGLSPIGSAATLRECASKCIMQAINVLGLQAKSTSVLLCSEKATREVTKAALEVGARVKYLHTECTCGGAGLNRLLMRELGLAEMAHGHAFDLAAVFDNKCELPDAPAAVNLSGVEIEFEGRLDFELSAGAELMQKKPPGVSTTIFACALHLSGAASANELTPRVIIKSALDR